MDLPILGQNNSPLMETKELDGSGEAIRLLLCLNCKSVEEIPDFQGHPDDDVLLQIIIEKHQSTGVPHKGNLVKVPLKLWMRQEVREQMLQQIRGGAAPGLDAMMPGYYDVKNQFFQDAMNCYAAHSRPKGQCPEFGDEKKRLVPSTTAERKELGLGAPTTSGTKVYLCDFCPVKSYNMTKARETKGMYK